MRLTLQASGYAGGWTNIFNDTTGELQAGVTGALQRAGFGTGAVIVEADQYDATARILYDKFSYRLTATVDTTRTVVDALAQFQTIVTNVAGFPASVSNLTAGDGTQPLANSNPLPALGDAVANVGRSLGLPLAAVAIIVVAVVIVLLKDT
jgi:hypothetical protein